MRDYIVDLNISKHQNIIVPISMNQDYHSGKKLCALVSKLKSLECQSVTVIVADWLRRWSNSEAESLEMGDNFLEENFHLFENMTVVRWKNWLETHQDEFVKNREKLTAIYKTDIIFQKKIERTAKTAILHNDIDSSRNYLLEELAVYLTFTNFDVHVYPQPISSAMAYLYILFPELKLPEYRQPILKMRSHELRSSNNLPLVARTVYAPLEDVLTSSEVHDKTKSILINRLFNLMISVYSRLDFEGKEPLEDVFSGIDLSLFK